MITTNIPYFPMKENYYNGIVNHVLRVWQCALKDRKTRDQKWYKVSWQHWLNEEPDKG